MTPLLVLAIMALVYSWRLLGFTLPLAPQSGFWRGFFQHLPIALFTTLTILPLTRDTADLDMKALALVVAGIVMWRTRHMGMSVLVGMGALWILSSMKPLP
jgi:branched-subunit amino acid transport protein